LQGCHLPARCRDGIPSLLCPVIPLPALPRCHNLGPNEPGRSVFVSSTEALTALAHPRKEIGDRVRQVRGRLTQQEFADKLQLSRSYISDVERGRSYPSIQFLAALAVTCDISLNWLLTGEGTDRKASYSLVKEGQEEDTLRQLTESLGDLYDGANRDWQGWVKIELSQLIETLQRANR